MINYIRQAGLIDVALLSNLSTLTFYETYAAYNTPENMQQYVEKYFNNDQLAKEINEAGNNFFIAFINEQAAGYVKLRTSEKLVELKNLKHIEIERIYVLQQYQKQKIGLQLINQSMKVAAVKGFEVIWLFVCKNYYLKRNTFLSFRF